MKQQKKGRTFYVKTKDLHKYCDPDKVASAGPYPNVAGMRKLYWGYACTIVRSGAYIYKID